MTVRREDCLDVATVPSVPVRYLPGVTAQELTIDERSGGDHQVVSYPAGWRSLEQGYLTAGQDLYVLEGDLTIGSARLVTGSYMYIPEGVLYGPVSTTDGCRVLTFHNKKHEFIAAQTSAPNADPSKVIGPIETWTLPWLDPMADIVKKSTWTDPNSGKPARPPGVLTKTLRHSHEGKYKELVALTSLAPGYIDPGTEHHPHDECLYLVAGDAYIGLTYDHKNEDRKEDLVLHRNHYIARPPHIKHGPVCTQSGALWLLYMNDKYTGLFEEVPDWRSRVQRYLQAAPFR
jgi:hypothetical protein